MVDPIYFLNVGLKSWLCVFLIFSPHFTFYPGDREPKRNSSVFLSAIFSNFLSVIEIGEESGNLESGFGINV